MEIFKLFETQSRQLFWREVDPAHLAGVPIPGPINPGEAYFTIRLCEIYLATARKLWRQIYPMLHCYTQFGPVESHVIVGPGQLGDLGDANLDRLANLNTCLSGPLPYNGEEVSILAGLYAIPGHDSAKALIDFASAVAILDPAPVGKGLALAGPIKAGIDSLLGLDQATLHLGVRDSFNPASRPLRSGYFVGIGAPDQTVDPSQIWVMNGRLMKGKDSASAAPYSDHDYMLITVERIDARGDWQQLPELWDIRRKFSNLMPDAQFSADEKRARLAALWPAFLQSLADSPNLIDSDRDRIAALTAADLLKRLKLQDEANPFLRAA